MTETTIIKLASLERNRPARIVGLCRQMPGNDNNDALERKLREMGFEEDREVEILHQGPFGRDPLAVRVDHFVLALRRAEAEMIEVTEAV